MKIDPIFTCPFLEIFLPYILLTFSLVLIYLLFLFLYSSLSFFLSSALFSFFQVDYSDWIEVRKSAVVWNVPYTALSQPPLEIEPPNLDCNARSQLLYRLIYPGSCNIGLLTFLNCEPRIVNDELEIMLKWSWPILRQATLPNFYGTTDEENEEF
jgi:hypothetical protein